MQGYIVHADGQVVSLGRDAEVNVITDNGDAAGAIASYPSQAVRWLDCWQAAPAAAPPPCLPGATQALAWYHDWDTRSTGERTTRFSTDPSRH